MLFYDTCALLNRLTDAFVEQFYISAITLRELENIKTSAFKDADIKYKARKLIHLLDECEGQYQIISYNQSWDNIIQISHILPMTDDSRIIISAMQTATEANPIIFVTDDACCKYLAKAMGLTVSYSKSSQNDYTGYYIYNTKSDEELAQIYSQMFSTKDWNELKENQYLLITDKDNQIVDKYKYTKQTFEKIPFLTFDSQMFGKIKPKDAYQEIAMDSLKYNKITMLSGSAGTGKSYLALGYLFSLLEKREIDKIIIFCNTVATMGSAKLGYYPGSRTEKLLDSQIGNFLSSKIGDRIEVERMIDDGKLELLPLSDIRGYDTTGLKAGIYITEAQNLDIELMKLALQRIGEDSICILDGDSNAQVDLSMYAGKNNGMRRVSEIFRGDKVYGEVTLKNIYRSRIAQLAELM